MKSNRAKEKEEPLSGIHTPIQKLRNSGFKIQDRSSDLYLLRNSFSPSGLRNFCLVEPTDFRHSNLSSLKKKQMDNLKQTLDKLEDKVNAVKQQLQTPSSTFTMMKKTKPLVHYQNLQASSELQKYPIDSSPTDSSITLKNCDKKLAPLITNIPKPKIFLPSYTNPYSPRRHSTYYISEAVRAVNQKNSLIVEHINASIRIIRDCEAYEIPSVSDMSEKKVSLKKREQFRKKKTLILDLDETLIHCVDNYDSECDLRLSIILDGQQNKPHKFGINIRPYALTFLKKMCKRFEIIVFTASQQEYADAILNELDPDNEIFQHRLYRQHCWVLENQMHIKDIRVLNRSLAQTVLVDNAAYSYCFQLQNGIPILPYYEGSDFELSALESYLQEIDRCADVRQLNKHTFKLHHYTKFSSGQELIDELYLNNSG